MEDNIMRPIETMRSVNFLKRHGKLISDNDLKFVTDIERDFKSFKPLTWKQRRYLLSLVHQVFAELNFSQFIQTLDDRN